MSRGGSRLAGVAVTAIATLAVASCSPVYEGMAGVTFDERGMPLVLVHPCRGEVSQIELGFSHGDAGSTGAYRVVAWDAAEPMRTPFSFSPWGAHSGWTLGQASGEDAPVQLTLLDPDAAYEVHGTRSTWDGVTYTQIVPFTVEELRALKPGQVRFVGWDDDGSVTVAPEKEFIESACRG